jgi:hypothetical protein
MRYTQYFQRAAGTGFILTAGVLIVFETVKGTKPSGHAVLPALWGGLVASALIWLIAEGLRLRAEAASARTMDEGMNRLIHRQWRALMRRRFWRRAFRRPPSQPVRITVGSTPEKPATASSAEPEQKEPVSPEHRDMLKEVACTLRSYVDASQHAYYAAKGNERHAQAFQEHFSDVAKRVASWNEQIAALEAERRELQEWVEGRLRALAFDQPPFAWGYAGLITELAGVNDAELPFHVPQIQPLWLQLGPYPLVPDPPTDGRTREAVEDELRGVLSGARQRPQCQQIRQIRGSLPVASEPLISELDLIQAKDVINGLGDCVLCR